MNLNELEMSVISWAGNRNLIKGTTPEKQMLKLGEEYGELIQCLTKDKPEEFKSELGDMLVVLSILSNQKGTSLEECFGVAWNKIKDRKGAMIDGYFVKEKDIKAFL